ncbi:MAG: FHA domain-containing protein, partial [bacterium]|nr:FHA domain-containing protein [bacterium]
MQASEKNAASLVCRSGAVAGIVYQLSASLTTVGRDSQCGIALTREAAVVSGRHAEIFAVDKGWAVRDLDSTNGTFLNGRRVQESNLAPGGLLQFGASGPEFEFRLEVRPTAAQFDRTLVDKPSPESKPKPGKEEMLAEAVRKARAARGSGAHGQTMTIMREVLGTAVKKSSQRLRWTVAILLIALVGVGGFSMWRIQDLKAEKNSIEDRILEIEEELESGNLNEAEIKALVDELDNYQRQALELQDSVCSRCGLERREAAFIEREILVLMKDFGAEGYAIPPEFVSQVGRFVERLQTRDRAIVEGVLGANREKFSTMREIFSSHKLPPDLAY